MADRVAPEAHLDRGEAGVGELGELVGPGVLRVDAVEVATARGIRADPGPQGAAVEAVDRDAEQLAAEVVDRDRADTHRELVAGRVLGEGEELARLERVPPDEHVAQLAQDRRQARGRIRLAPADGAAAVGDLEQDQFARLVVGDRRAASPRHRGDEHEGFDAVDRHLGTAPPRAGASVPSGTPPSPPMLPPASALEPGARVPASPPQRAAGVHSDVHATEVLAR